MQCVALLSSRPLAVRPARPALASQQPRRAAPAPRLAAALAEEEAATAAADAQPALQAPVIDAQGFLAPELQGAPPPPAVSQLIYEAGEEFGCFQVSGGGGQRATCYLPRATCQGEVCRRCAPHSPAPPHTPHTLPQRSW